VIISAPRQDARSCGARYSSGLRSMRWVVGVGAAGSVEGLVACPKGVQRGPLKVPLRTTGSRSPCDTSDETGAPELPSTRIS
jgi:hypothetical protein